MLTTKQTIRSNQTAINLFWIGFIIYAAAFSYSAVAMRNYVVAFPIQSIAIIVIVYSSIQLIRFKLENNYLKLLFVLYCSWLCVVVFRGFVLDYEFIKELLFDAEHGVLIYFVPLILLFPQSILFYKKVFAVVVALAIIFLAYTVLFRDNILNVKDYFIDTSSAKYTYDYFIKILSVPTGFLILTYTYHNNKIKLLAVITIAIAVLFAIIRARRALLFMSVCPLVFAGILYAFFSGKKFVFISLCILTSCFLLASGFKMSQGSTKGIFSLLLQRVDEDTRTPVEICLYNDMTAKDWIIGRGIDGQYYCPNIDENDVTGYRNIIETDYLNIILKGGILSIGLLLLIAIPALVKGLFYSKNLLSKAAGIWIFLWIIDLYPATVYTFSLNYVLVWISIGICYNKGIRNMPESELKAAFLAATYGSKKAKTLNVF